MQSQAATVEAYLKELPEERKEVIEKLRAVILKNLPKGFKESMGYGMMGYAVPHSIYPNGYHCNPKDPLPFMGLASQKNSVNLYHMGIYMDHDLYEWFVNEYPKHSQSKLDMGKSCIRFKKMNDIPYELIGALASKMTVQEWIGLYESMLDKSAKKK